ncbi:hypothetical protein EYC80_003588 [Monilinia laxa]|uniref:Zn(2)-C6 fungal-type domain-containing protein n=1 Tax=Monilinia laxa TaxID=61186 RepID=A0A5N6KLZ5_MONLA|nr:hypothetical protein EYC80_003588 [Monilinia laxa]
MQNFSFAPTNYGPRENQKNYVFVDEHNRHKRLKVMRACEGCRRRKIKCDAATTNTWPCSACTRLKLGCVPPTVNYDRDFQQNHQTFEAESGQYNNGGNSGDGYHQQVSVQQQMSGPSKVVPPIYTQQPSYSDPNNMYQTIPYGGASSAHSQQSMHYNTLQTPVSALSQHTEYSPQTVYPPAPLQQQTHDSPENYTQSEYGGEDLADLLGELKMNPAGTAPYLNNKNRTRTLVEEPAFEDVDEFKNALPPTPMSADMKIRIPPELLPDEQTILHYFDMYFTNWHTNRDAISPLILEAIFAIAGRLDDEPAQGHQWLALASSKIHLATKRNLPLTRYRTCGCLHGCSTIKHPSSKFDYTQSKRIRTKTWILLYRSWMTVVACVQMAKDLGLDEHYEDHKAGRTCGSDLADCITKTRVWQTIFVCELMIGSPQGRTDLAVDMETLDLSVPRAGIDNAELTITRNFTWFTRVVRNVRRMNNVYAKVKKRKEWGIDPDFVQLNPSFETWMNDLPENLQINFPADGSPPWLPTHFIGNLHSYYYLSIIMLHRPQLTFMEPGMDGWKHHMLICYNSAKLLCRLQEAVLHSFGLTGLLCMQRGINFTIYCVLTCTVLHLVAITSPDPDLNSDAREFFTRHMRILEKCTSSWPMPDMQQQIESLRLAFSADIRKPFVLKPSFPYGSPAAPANTSPARGSVQQYRQGSTSMESQGLGHQNAQQQSLVMMATGQRGSVPITSGVPMADHASWNPSRIFDQWNSTFGTPPASSSSASETTPPLKTPSSGAQELPTLPEIQIPPNVSLPPGSQPMPPQQYSGAPIPSFVSPSMWQESVANVYESGIKRQWDYSDPNEMVNPISKRRG